MKKCRCARCFTIIVSFLLLLSTLSGCQSGKRFDSSESMISEMIGTYVGSTENSGERVIIDSKRIIQFNIDDIFPQITDPDVFWKNFPQENWHTLDLNTLLCKPYIEISAEPISADIKASTISGLWINKDGVLFDRNSCALIKKSSDSVYPTAEMQEKFEEYLKYLQEYERSIIVEEASKQLIDKQEALHAALSSATSAASAFKKSTASAETIAECAFDSLKDHIKYPRTAKLDGYSTSPQYDPYGRVLTLVAVTSQNGFGNYITEDIYVVLQSCSYTGLYTHMEGVHYTKNSLSELFLYLNDWDKDPSADNSKEETYNNAIQFIKGKDYSTAVKKLDLLGDYKASIKLKEACTSLIFAKKYKDTIDLFAAGEYSAANEALYALMKEHDGGYLRAGRVVLLCNAAISHATSNNNNTSTDSNISTSVDVEKKYCSQCGADCTANGLKEGEQCEDCYYSSNSGNTTNNSSSSGSESDLSTSPDSGNNTEQKRTCPQCGESEPDAIFTEDWQPGDICFGCSYDNFHGGKDAKVYCAQCGADCTYRGLAGDGLCDDCYHSSNTPNAPAACEHSYTDATCTAPKICTLCGETSGEAFGHTYSAATCTKPRTCSVCGAASGTALGHNWNDITETVYHEEQGHYEDVQDAQKVQKYRCPRCGYSAPTYATKSEYYAHFDSAHRDELNSSFDRERYEMVSDWVYETVTVWVVDQKAYTETIVTGRKCTICEMAE